eukprot:6485494-Pyramimonas_sp.AAC.1
MSRRFYTILYLCVISKAAVFKTLGLGFLESGSAQRQGGYTRIGPHTRRPQHPNLSPPSAFRLIYIGEKWLQKSSPRLPSSLLMPYISNYYVVFGVSTWLACIKLTLWQLLHWPRPREVGPPSYPAWGLVPYYRDHPYYRDIDPFF